MTSPAPTMQTRPMPTPGSAGGMALNSSPPGLDPQFATQQQQTQQQRPMYDNIYGGGGQTTMSPSQQSDQQVFGNWGVGGAGAPGDPSRAKYQAPNLTPNPALNAVGVDPYTDPRRPGYQYGAGQGGPVQGQVAGTSVDTSRVNPADMPVDQVGPGQQYQTQMQDAYMRQAQARLDPQWGQREEALRTQLANQGITPGSEAWNNAMRQQAFERNDAYGSAQNQAILASGAEAQRMQGMNIAGGQFANAAAQQEYANRLTSQDAANRASGQQFGQNLAGGQFANAAQNQQFQQQAADAQIRNAAMTAGGGLINNWNQSLMGNALGRYQAELGAQTSRDTTNIGAGATLAAAAAGADVANRRTEREYDLRQQGQDWDMYRQGVMLPLEYQNLAMQGMYPTGMPNTPNYPTAPAIPGGNQVASGNNQAMANNDFWNAAGSFAGNYFRR